jgi:hypothetical protein
MAVEFLAGMVPTADELQALVGIYVVQGAAQSVTSSTTLVDSMISIPISGLCSVELRARYTSGSSGGGIRWAWGSTGTVASLARTAITPGSGAGSGGALTVYDSNQNFRGVRMRQIAGLTEVHEINNYSGSTTQYFGEDLVLEGSGLLVLRFAQQASNAAATTLHQNSYAIARPIRSA